MVQYQHKKGESKEFSSNVSFLTCLFNLIFKYKNKFGSITKLNSNRNYMTTISDVE